MESRQKIPNFFLRQASSGAQPQFSDDEEVTMETNGLKSDFALTESQKDAIIS